MDQFSGDFWTAKTQDILRTLARGGPEAVVTLQELAGPCQTAATLRVCVAQMLSRVIDPETGTIRATPAATTG